MKNRSKTNIVARTEMDDGPQESLSDSEGQSGSFTSNLSETRSCNGWSYDDEKNLIDNIKVQPLLLIDRKYSTQIQKIEWDKVKFGSYSASDCEKHFNDLVRSVRTYRILPEILNDIESELSKLPFKRPPSGYNLFIKDEREHNNKAKISDLAKKFNDLPSKQKKQYEAVAQKLRNDYNARLKDFYKDNPKTADLKLSTATKSVKGQKVSKGIQTPFKVFCEYQSLVGNKATAATIRSQYTELSHDAKYKWVSKAVKLNPNLDQEKFLNKEERRILSGQLKPAPTGYSLFLKHVYPEYKESGKSSSEIFSSIGARWRALSSTKKAEFIGTASEMKKSQQSVTKSFVEGNGIKVLATEKKIRTRVRRQTSSSSSGQSYVDELIATLSLPKSAITPKKKASKTSLLSATESPIKARTTPSKSPQKLSSPRKSSGKLAPKDKDNRSPSPISNFMQQLENQKLELSPSGKPSELPSDQSQNTSNSNESSSVIKNFMDEIENQFDMPSSAESTVYEPSHIEHSPEASVETSDQTQDDSQLFFLPPINSTKHQLDFASPKPSQIRNHQIPLRSILKRKPAFVEEDWLESSPVKKPVTQNPSDSQKSDTTDSLDKLKYNNYTYVIRKAVSESKFKWNCNRKEKKQCEASITTELIDGVHSVVKERGTHNHLAKQKKT